MRSHGYRKLFSGGILGVIGYLLSPLSWWNDAFINIPIAYGFAWLISLLDRPLFVPALIFFYWVTNIAGFVLLHKGIEKIAQKSNDRRRYSRKDFLKDLAISIAYTTLIIALAKMKIIVPPGEF
jgi:uncharacterized membrane protein